MALAFRIPENPILLKEMRVRMRGGRTYWVLLLYVGILIISFVLAYLNWARSLQDTNWTQAAQFGHDFFWTMVIVQLCLVIVLAPAFTCGSISSEREQQTLAMLQITMMRPRAVLSGKLISALSYVVLLTVSSVPLLAICFLFGGVSPDELLTAYLVLLGTAFFLGISGLFCSAVAKRTITATALAYGLTMFLCLGTLMLDAFMQLGSGSEPFFLYLNPFFAILSVMDPRFIGRGGANHHLITMGLYGGLALFFLLASVHLLYPSRTAKES